MILATQQQLSSVFISTYSSGLRSNLHRPLSLALHMGKSINSTMVAWGASGKVDELEASRYPGRIQGAPPDIVGYIRERLQPLPPSLGLKSEERGYTCYDCERGLMAYYTNSYIVI